MNKITFAVLAAGVVAASQAGAQTIARASSVPPGQRPPTGMCRVWIDGVAPGRQPRATTCEIARANAPANSMIVYGSDTPFPGRGARETRQLGTWYPAGRDGSGNAIFTRRVRMADGRIVVQRARRTSSGQMVLVEARGDRDNELKRARKEREKKAKRATRSQNRAEDRDADDDNRGRRNNNNSNRGNGNGKKRN